MRRLSLALAFLAAAPLAAQDRAPRFRQLVAGLTVTPRVLVIGAHPDDDDPQLITWLARGRSVQTGYLSLTRGEAGQNFAGSESGAALSAVRTRELLAARRIDGGQQYFTSAIDFGASKNTDEVFKHWSHQGVLRDIVTVIRSFRPHVIVCVFPETFKDGDGQHEALGLLAREAFDAATDTVRFRANLTGMPWQPLKLYRHGAGLTMSLDEYEPLTGRTLADIAVEARAQTRTQGLSPNTLRRVSRVQLVRVASRVNDSTPPAEERSIFDGIDTSFARLSAGARSNIAQALASFLANADSARAALDVSHPDAIVPYLVRAARLTTMLRRSALWCRHVWPEASIPTVIVGVSDCDQHGLDLDASIDLMQRRTSDALLLAAGVSFEATSDRELLATADTIPVSITMFNRGTRPVTFANVVVSGGSRASMTPVIVAPDSTVREFRTVTGLVDGHPWWLGKREPEWDMYSSPMGAIDGVERGALLPNGLAVMGVAIPEGIRRESDVTVTIAFDGATITKSLGPVIHRYADPIVGVQDRPISGVPAVSLAFERPLEWIPARKPIARQIRLAVKSFSDRPQSFKPNIVTPIGMRADSVPETVTLEPREQRELFLRTRSVLEPGRHVFGIVGRTPENGQFNNGFRVLQYSYLEPMRFFRSSGVYVQAVDVNVPPNLSVVYVAGSADDTPNALKGVGVTTSVVSPEDLLAVDLAKISTLVIGPRVYDAYPQLIDQTGRLLEFVRKGGTIVTLQHASIPSRVLPYPIMVARPIPIHVTYPDAAVTLLDPKARLLSWPNVIGDGDWSDWARARALFVPTTVDPRWTPLLEARDHDAEPTRNTLLSARVGKGTYIYTTLSLTEQIDSGVAGALRLLVNLLSAGQSSEKKTPVAGR